MEFLELKKKNKNKNLKQKLKLYLPIIILFAIGENLLMPIIRLFIYGEFRLNFSDDAIVIFINLIILPFAAIVATHLVYTHFQRDSKSNLKYIMSFSIAPILTVFITSYILESIYGFFGYLDDDYFVMGDLQMNPAMTDVIQQTIVAVFFCVPLTVWHIKLEKATEKINSEELKNEKLEKLRVEAELQALQSKINPHFLFNVFNSIASLIHKSPEIAEQMIVNLAELFRYAINSESKILATIKEEIEIAELYLKIEKIRFGNKIKYEINYDKNVKEIEVPRFLLQPLIENASKHGIADLINGEIVINIAKEAEKVVIEVIDNGKPFEKEMIYNFGIKSTIDKLNYIYGDNYSIDFISNPIKKVEIKLPINR
jgi:hypothetical protein